jgi:membrane protein YqaA with SNARE-associated domain
MTGLEWLLIAYAVVFAMNVIPAFMPPTWIVVSFFLIAYHLPFWLLCLGAALSATSGRCVLAYLSRRWGRQLLSGEQRQNVSALGDWLSRKSGWSQALAVLIYCLGPIPSNQMFIAAGLANARLGPVAAGFFAGRLVSYPLFAVTAKGVSDHFGSIFVKEWHDPKFLFLELLSIAGVVLFAHIDWPKVLHLSVPSVRSGNSPGVSANAQANETRIANSRPPALTVDDSRG